MRRLLESGAEDRSKLELAKAMRRRMTHEETLLWAQLRDNKLHGWHFRRQQVLAGFILDFYCHRARLVIEVDGPIHDQQFDYDAERDTILRGHDLEVLRLQNHEVRDQMPKVLECITQACSNRIANSANPS